ncbi:MAG: S8 family serine peptidase [Phaeodactylibacter sp.]|nr:S8 family serine peptidase [Phaeodactylibacter sp.]
MIYRFFWLSTLLFTALFAQAQLVDPATGQVKNELLVQLDKDAGVATLVQKINRQKAGSARYGHAAAKSLNIHLLQFDPAAWPADALMDWLRRQKEVTAAQYNYQIAFRQEPNDPDFVNQWGFPRIGLMDVWDISTGGLTANGDTIVVAVLDSGCDLGHPDLQGNIWNNAGEKPGDGIDNDGNGYIDDTFGWNFVDASNEMRINGHGTAVTGLIGAKGNNGIGISGTNWDIKVMVFAIQYVDQIISAYEYVIDQRRRYNESGGSEGAFVAATNASFGLTTPTFCDEQPIWGSMYDKMGDVGILTGAGTANRNLNVDEEGDMPTSCESDFIITVTNMNEDEVKESSSGYGEASIDMAAPGQNSYSLWLFDRYAPFDGNSAAAPHLTGAIALLYSMPCEELASDALSNPRETALLIRSTLINGTEPLASLEGLTATGGLLNVFNAMEILNEACGGTSGPLDILRIYPNPTSEEFFVEYETPDFEPYDFRVYNALGQEMYRNTETPPRFATKRLRIDTRNWAPGVYFAAIQRGEDREVKPVMVKVE